MLLPKNLEIKTIKSPNVSSPRNTIGIRYYSLNDLYLLIQSCSDTELD